MNGSNVGVMVGQKFFEEKPPWESCRNYSTWAICSAMADKLGPRNTSTPLGLTQSTYVDGNAEDADYPLEIPSFEDIDFANKSEPNDMIPARTTIAYQRLHPLLKELSPFLTAPEDIQKWEILMSSEMVLQKQKIQLVSGKGKRPAGKFVSVSVESSKKRKTHGTKHYW